MTTTVEAQPKVSRSARYRRVMESLMIRDEHGRIVPLHFSDSQEILWSQVAPRLERKEKIWDICLKPRQVYACLDPSTRVLTADLRWVPIESLTVGQRLLTVDENPPGGKGPARKMRTGEVVAVREVYEPAFRLIMNNGESLIATREHRFLTSRSGRPQWIAVARLKPGHRIRTITQPWGESSYEDGWFGGFLDGEGSLRFRPRRSGVAVSVCQVPGPALDRATTYLKERGYAFGVQWDEREPGPKSKLGTPPLCRLVVSRMSEIFRLIGQTQPTRFLERAWWEGKELPGKRTGQCWSDIAAIVSLGPRRMLDLQTTQGTFIAEGFVSHNSTFYCGLGFVRTLEAPLTHSLVIAQDLDTASELFDKVKFFYEHFPLPRFGKPTVKTLNIPLPGGVSRYRVISAGIAAKGRGTTQTVMHISEVAFCQHPEFMTGILQAMPDLDNTILVIESTANGMRGTGQMFYEEWMRAVSGESGLNPIFIPWWVMPKYRKTPGIPADDWDEDERLLHDLCHVDGEQLAWRRWAINTKLQGSADLFNQEYPSTPEMAFIFSGSPAFDHRAIYRQRDNVRTPLARGTLTGPERKDWTDDPKGDIRIWKWPEAGYQYVIGADTSEGIEGGDYACAEVLDMQSLEQVSVAHGLIPTWDFATLVNYLGRFYHNAVLAVEVNNTGHAVQDHLIHHYYYPRLHRWRGKPDRIKWGDSKLYGWETNTYSRPLLIEAGRRAVNTNLVTIREEKLLDELKHFSKNDFGKYEAEAGHDDRVLALLIALRSREENYFPARVASESISDHALVGLPTGVHVVDQDEPTYAGRKKIGQILRDRAKQAVKGWMEYLWVIGLLYGTPTIV